MDEMQLKNWDKNPCRPVAIFSPLIFRGYCDSFTDRSVLGLSPGLDYSVVDKKYDFL